MIIRAIILACMIPLVGMGQAMQFSGTAQCGVIAQNSIGGFKSVSMWLKYSGNSGYNGLFSHNNFRVYLDTGTKNIILGNAVSGLNSGYSMASAAYSNKWTHIACVSSGTTGRIFINGAMLYSGSLDLTTAVNGVRIGGWLDGTLPLLGGMADVRIYSRTLTDGDVASIANAYPRGSDGITAGLVGRWRGSSDQTGATLANGTRIPDISGNGNHGYAANGVVSSASIIGNRRTK